jgi:N utilization substance protein B
VTRETYPRSLAREVAFQFLYQNELNPRGDSDGGPIRWQDVDLASLLAFARQMFEILYREESDREAYPPREESVVESWSESPLLPEFALSLVVGVCRHREALDARLSAAAEHWSLNRMAPTDLTILRLGAYEILYADTPGPVAVDEAIELGKRFGGAQSGQFVNGILDRLMQEDRRE